MFAVKMVLRDHLDIADAPYDSNPVAAMEKTPFKELQVYVLYLLSAARVIHLVKLELKRRNHPALCLSRPIKGSPTYPTKVNPEVKPNARCR